MKKSKAQRIYWHLKWVYFTVDYRDELVNSKKGNYLSIPECQEDSRDVLC